MADKEKDENLKNKTDLKKCRTTPASPERSAAVAYCLL